MFAAYILMHGFNLLVLQELPQEYARFARVDKSYMKMTKRAHDTKNVLQVTLYTLQTNSIKLGELDIPA